MDVPILKRLPGAAPLCCDYPVPGPQGQLSKRLIELAALDLIEEVGLEAFSTRKLAERLGCKAMSIYHYFPSKGHLMDGLIDHLIAEVLPFPPDDLPWMKKVLHIGRSFRALALRRPAIFVFVATHRMNTPFSLAFIDRLIGIMAESGLGPEDTARMFRSFGYYIMGNGLDEAAGYSRGPSTITPVGDEDMARDYPHVAVSAPYFREPERERTFELGLDLLLSGWQARAEARLKSQESTQAYQA